MAALALLVVLGAGLSGCSDGDAGAAETATAVPEQPESGFNHSDIAFMQMMVPHHAQALEMAELASERAVDRGVRRIAARVRAAQGP
ncbi:DUF305 domain-containing protein [uncultured Nocardioides sp.]|uniref:DUF305 domain-containing protein n=1 Tax=uncultured Nocardioides sp. TaxID=198441 RepID=UPI0025EA2CE6|nr:DUF305 domain-containing protein [uncultured Nocardioides sp.]